MNVGLRPLRVGSFRHWYALKIWCCLVGCFCFGWNTDIRSDAWFFFCPGIGIGRALFAPENVSTDARYIVQIFACRESSWHCYAEPC